MLSSQIPVKFPIPFANGATSSFIRQVPTASQIGITNGAASLTDGFPPDTFIPESGGGTPPFGQDTNGILFQISAWSRWQNAGAPVTYDSAFSTAIGGYPNGAMIMSAAGLSWWLSTTDNNTTDPDTGGSGWIEIAYGNTGPGNPNGNIAGVAPVNGCLTAALYYDTGATKTGLWLCTSTGTSSTAVWVQIGGGAATEQVFYCGTTAGTVNAQTLVATGVPSISIGTIVNCVIGSALTNTGATTIKIGSSLGPYAVRKDSPSGPIALTGGELVAANAASFLFDGTYMHLRGPALGTASQANASSATGTVAAVTGSFTIGHAAGFSDTSGTIEDIGLPAGVNLLNTLTGSGSATLSDITSFTSTYSYYEIVIENLQSAVPGSGAETLGFQVTENGGTTWIAANYQFNIVTNVVGTTTSIFSLSSGIIETASSASLNSGATTVNGTITVSTPSGTTAPKYFLWHLAGITGNYFDATGSGAYVGDDGAINGIRFTFGGINIVSGTIKIYGRA